MLTDIAIAWGFVMLLVAAWAYFMARNAPRDAEEQYWLDIEEMEALSKWKRAA